MQPPAVPGQRIAVAVSKASDCSGPGAPRRVLAMLLAGCLCVFALLVPAPAAAGEWLWNTHTLNSVRYIKRQQHPTAIRSEFVVSETIKNGQVKARYRGPHRGSGEVVVEHHSDTRSVREYRHVVEDMGLFASTGFAEWLVANDAGEPIRFRLRPGDVVIVEFRFDGVKKIKPPATGSVVVDIETAPASASAVRRHGPTGKFQVASGTLAKRQHWLLLSQYAKTESFPSIEKHPKKLALAMLLTESAKAPICVGYLGGSWVGSIRTVVKLLRADGSKKKKKVKMVQPDMFSGTRGGCTGKLRYSAGDWLEVTNKFRKFRDGASFRLTVSSSTIPE